MKYQDYLKTEDWKSKRTEKRAKKRNCGICGSNEIDIHHLNYKNLFDVRQEDLRRMCRRCHFLAHNLMEAGKIKFRSTNHHSRWCILKAAVKRELGIVGKNMFV